MTETVVVAIITAASTLVAAALGSLLTAYVSLRSTRDAQAQRRRSEHRLARRDAYVRFLTDAIATAAALRSARVSDLPEAEFRVRYESAERALMELIPVHSLVIVEGPDELGRAANKVRAALGEELGFIREVRQQLKPESALRDARDQRAQAVGEMAVKAREALGGDVDTS